MEEAAKCDRVCIIDHGEILELKTPHELRIQYAPTLLRIKTDSLDEESIKRMNVTYQKINDGYEIVLKESKDAYPILDSYRNQIDQFEVLEGTMDTVFLALTGKTIREDES